MPHPRVRLAALAMFGAFGGYLFGLDGRLVPEVTAVVGLVAFGGIGWLTRR